MLSFVSLYLFGLLPISFAVSSWGDDIIIGPANPSDYNSWLSKITTQRQQDLNSINYNGSIFKVPGIQWTQSSFIQPQSNFNNKPFFTFMYHHHQYH